MLFLNKKPIVFPLLLVLLSIVVGGFGCKKSKDETTALPAAPGATPPETTSISPPSLPVSSTEPAASRKVDNELVTLAQDFAEVWGTFSSESNCQNIKDLLDYMSEYFRREQEDYLEYECTRGYEGTPFEWQTRALEAVILDQSEDRAEILVVTERTRKEAQYTKIYYPNLILELVIETNTEGQDEWRVDSVSWAETE